MRSLRCRLGLAAFALLLAPLASASVTLPLPWKLGTSLRYQASAVQEDSRAGKNRKTESRSTQTLEIVEAGPKGFLQVWKSADERTTVTGTLPDVEDSRRTMLALAARMDPIPVEAELEPDGSFRRIRNWQAFATAMREVMLPALLEQNRAKAQAAKIDEAALREKLMPLVDKLTSEPAVSAAVGRPAAIFNFFTAAQLRQGKAVEYEDYLPSPWSADLIPTRGSFTLEKLDADTATIRWRQRIDPVKGAQVMWNIVEALGGAKIPEAERKGLPEGLALVDEASVVIERKTGVPLRLDYSRSVEAGQMHKTTRLQLEKLP